MGTGVIVANLVKLSNLPGLDTTPAAGSPVGRDPYTGNLQPLLNPMMRCPLPGVNASPDALRQFYRGGQLPQTRVLVGNPNSPITSLSGGSGSVVSTGSGGGSGTGVKLQILQTAVTTTVLAPNNVFTGTINLGKAFQLIGLSTSVEARVQLYSTLNSLQLDSFREIDVAPPFGTEQGIIFDVALDTSPLIWNLDGLVGANFDNPITSLEYIAITNIGQAATPIVATIIYIPFVS